MNRPKSRLAFAFVVALACAHAAAAVDAQTAASGLKEALNVGTGRAVDLLGRLDGYLGNPEVRIPVPERLEKVGRALDRIGLGGMVEEFETGMNRAAEAAAPLAKQVFVDAIREMSFSDALKILRGDGHEATDYLREQAGPVLSERFRPIVTEQLESVGATRSFNSMMERYSDLPFVSRPDFDLERYVTQEGLDGLFLMIAREEEKIRKDPLARTTDLLKKVFGEDDADGEGGKRPWWKRLFGS